MFDLVRAVQHSMNCDAIQANILLLTAARKWVAGGCEVDPDSILHDLGVESDYLLEFINISDQLSED